MQVSTTQMDVICNDSRIALVLSPEGTSQDRKVLFQAQGGGSHLEGDILSNKLSYPRATKDLAHHQEPCSPGQTQVGGPVIPSHPSVTNTAWCNSHTMFCACGFLLSLAPPWTRPPGHTLV